MYATDTDYCPNFVDCKRDCVHATDTRLSAV